MAFQLDSNIPLLARSGSPVAAANQAVQFGSMLDQLRTTREEKPIRQQLLQQQQEAGELAIQQQQQAVQAADQDRVITSVAQGAQEILPFIDSGDFSGAVDKLKARRERLVSEGVTDLSDTDLAIQALESGDAQQIQRIKTDANAVINIAETRGLLTASGGKSSAEQRGFENLIADMSKDDQVKARRIKAGLDPKAGSSAEERIALNEQLTDLVASSTAQIAGRKAESVAEGKAKGEAKTAPLVAKAKADIAVAVKLAVTEATARGETLTDLKRANAALPGLRSVVDQLKELAPIATSTLGGRVFDTVVKESGFGSTKGATAKAKFISIINNQILPLLKPTFGGAFTVQEGDALKATLGDPDASPAQKLEQLNSFIDAKVREIEGKERELGIDQAPEQSSFTSSSGITFTVN